jgi:hypothetical protein
MDRYVRALTKTFSTAGDKHLAHRQGAAILQDMAGDPAALSEAFRRHLLSENALGRRHYPVVSVLVESNPHFELVANCWIPLPDQATDVTTKAIHHHGTMLLTTVTAFGPGYEHWTFTPPRVVEAERALFSMRVIEHGQHPLGHVAFVDAHVAHVPMYAPGDTVTLALWSSSQATSWKDQVKRVALLQRNSSLLRRLAVRAGMASVLDLQVVEYFDFHPSRDGFVGMRGRTEFPLGPNADYVSTLFHVLQTTGNERLAPLAEEVAARRRPEDPILVQRLVADLRAGNPIAARLSPGHTGVPFANFTRADIERAVAVCSGERQ